MASDVETILNEIRSRVLAEERAAAPSLDLTPRTQSPNGLAEPAVVRSEILERVAAHLSVTARAWDRLPPVFSNRRGLVARIELWLKNSCKPLTRWFTWEQVNFNAAVHHALNDLLAVATAQGRELAAVREDAVARNQKLEALEREFQSLRSLLETQAQELRRLSSTQAKDRADFHARLSETEAALAPFDARLTETEAALARFSNTLSSLAQQIAETANDLREEQRVCFKQLSLEASEAAVLEDRGRRAVEARVEKLEQRNSA